MLFNNPETYNDHHDQILHLVRFEVFLTECDREREDALVQWLSWSLPPAVLFQEKLLSNIRLFLTPYQYFMMNNISMNEGKHFTVSEQIANKLCKYQILEKDLEYKTDSRPRRKSFR